MQWRELTQSRKMKRLWKGCGQWTKEEETFGNGGLMVMVGGWVNLRGQVHAFSGFDHQDLKIS